MTLQRPHAQLLHAQLKDLPSVLVDFASHLSLTVLQLFQEMTSTFALEMLTETLFLALTVPVLPLLNNADLSYLAQHSS